MANVKPVITSALVQWLDSTDLSEADLVLDPELNRLLDSIRTSRPVKLKCGAAQCETILAYWAVASGHTARIIPGPGRKPRGKRAARTHRMKDEYRPGRKPPNEKYIVAGAADLVFPDFGREQRLEEAIEYAIKGEGMIRCEPNPDVGSGWPLRWEFVCPRKTSAGVHPTFQYTNREMLSMFERAVRFKQDTIRPDRLW